MRKDTRTVFRISRNDIHILNWCLENFGQRHRKRWGHSSLSNWSDTTWPARSPLDIYINNKEDAMAFKLRWM